MDELAENTPSMDEPPAELERQPAPPPRGLLYSPSRRRFHASQYQFNLKNTLWLFTVFSLLFLPMSAVAPQERFVVGALLAVSVVLAIYAFALISWIPNSALVIFLVSAPVVLVVLLSAVAWFTGL